MNTFESNFPLESIQYIYMDFPVKVCVRTYVHVTLSLFITYCQQGPRSTIFVNTNTTCTQYIDSMVFT